MPRILLWVVFVSSVWAPAARARVFDFKDAGVAPYLRGTAGLSAVGQEPFNHSSGPDTTVDGSTKYDYSGELGVLIPLGGDLRMRLGAELIQHRPVSDAPGTDSTGKKLFTLKSSVNAFNPNVTFEYAYKTAGNLRYYMMAGVGYADVTVENAYAMTTDGQNDLHVGDFTEKLAAQTVSWHAGVGLETLFTDNVTFSFDAGYRYLPVKTLRYKGDVDTVLAPTGARKGDEVLNDDGGPRRLNLGGLTLGVTFKFYIHFI
jgi:opacity protein-like surface antigen